ncbi:hypothetical protein CEUSTIGMA_g4939.t1 [Chlamydomonas eustigma]|uniref:5'-Nucleotidase C-terminal domain-containing protein n=1 Tax=Chlamydomonas eustigma TaxID=1157962 RepID=A0A250X355_9CHLO|nr:hypothetical protein CEUSTIGMA_g4939.t1 [Chlamydomonas eustigma]|eukprot:GAX77495.1 hypothetical protein CEUSTIGMA_g4939.t1 [Chlamydomonas eustigma]
MVKSGTDFRDLTKVDVILPGPGQKPKITWQRITMDSTVPQDPETEELVNSFMGKMASRMSETIGHSAQDLDGRFNTVRTKESNLGNFICDILRKATDADMVLINGGTFRSDAIHSAGPFTLGDLLSIMTMVDPILVIEATGEQILQGLENGVSMYPKLEGRFPQVAGISFMFDPDAPPRQRIMSGSILVGGEPLDMKRKYRLGTKGYVAEGKDGYDVFKSCQVLVDDEAGPVIPTAIRNHFKYLEVLNKWDPNARIQKFARIWRKNASKDKKLNELGDGAKEDEHELPARHAVPREGDSSTCLMDGQYCINPAVDGRIMMV